MARTLVLNATGKVSTALIDELVDKGIAVKDADRHFVSFCKKRGPYR